VTYGLSAETEWKMTCHRIENGILCTFADPVDYRIIVSGKEYRFEFGPYTGPGLLTKNDMINNNPPRAFLRAASLWNLQGKRIDAEGLCIWHEPRKPVLERRGRQIVYAEDGEEGWDW
jgi:hypothetical protein